MRFIILFILCFVIYQPICSQENIPAGTENTTPKNINLADLTLDELKDKIYNSTKSIKVTRCAF